MVLAIPTRTTADTLGTILAWTNVCRIPETALEPEPFQAWPDWPGTSLQGCWGRPGPTVPRQGRHPWIRAPTAPGPCPQRPKLGPSQAPNLGPCIGQATQACMQHTQPQKNIRNLPQKHQCFTFFSRWAQKFKIARPDPCPGLQRHGSKVDPRGSKLLPRSSKFWFQAAPPRIQACGAHHFFVPRGP